MASELVAFRYCDYDVPFWVRTSTRPGRWHRTGHEPTQYWSLTPDGAWAELIRFEELQTERELDEVRMPLWVCRAPAAGLANLAGNPTLRERYDLTEDDLTAEDWTACQDAAPRLRRRYRGVLSPSAALDGALNLTLFGPRRMIALERKPALASAVPAALASIGRPPRGLVGRVRRRGVMTRLFD